MPLPIQFFTVPFGAEGLDTKSDPKETSGLLQLQNATLGSTGQLLLRSGYQTLPRGVDGSTLLISGSFAIAPVNTGELLAFDGTNAYTFLSASQDWVLKGKAISCVTSDRTIQAGSRQLVNPSCATMSGTTVWAWQQCSGSNDGVFMSVQDEATQAFAQQNVLLNNQGFCPQVVQFGTGSLMVLYLVPHGSGGNNTPDVRYRIVQCADPTQVGTEVTAWAQLDMSGSYFIDACSQGGQAYVMWNSFNSTYNYQRCFVGAISASQQVTPVVAVSTGTYGMSLAIDSGGYLVIPSY